MIFLFTLSPPLFYTSHSKATEAHTKDKKTVNSTEATIIGMCLIFILADMLHESQCIYDKNVLFY